MALADIHMCVGSSGLGFFQWEEMGFYWEENLSRKYDVQISQGASENSLFPPQKINLTSSIYGSIIFNMLLKTNQF